MSHLHGITPCECPDGEEKERRANIIAAEAYEQMGTPGMLSLARLLRQVPTPGGN